MPAAEVDVGLELVRGLLADQRPDLSDLAVTPLGSGWDNFSFRLGDRHVARFPRRLLASALVENEARWLPLLAPSLPLPVPAPHFLGSPGRGYPWRWVISPWIPGEPVGGGEPLDPVVAAQDLAAFLAALHQPAPPTAPRNRFRGIPLGERDATTRQRIRALSPQVDPAALLEIWDEALEIPGHTSLPRWLHGDLHPLNLLAENGRLTGVIDFGDITSGDPATDLAVAWMLFDRPNRESLRARYGDEDEELWIRARGWALSLATSHLAHSADNLAMGAVGRLTIDRILG
jgi:aminoglycoside phosphotransferase (APT) family kinase protein